MLVLFLSEDVWRHVLAPLDHLLAGLAVHSMLCSQQLLASFELVFELTFAMCMRAYTVVCCVWWLRACAHVSCWEYASRYVYKRLHPVLGLRLGNSESLRRFLPQKLVLLWDSVKSEFPTSGGLTKAGSWVFIECVFDIVRAGVWNTDKLLGLHSILEKMK